jgi:O-antigen ligase
MFGATLLFEIFPLNFSDSLTDRVQFFLNLSTSNSSLQGVSITPFELLLVSVILIWIASSVAQRRPLELPKGPIVSAYAIYAAVVIAAEVRGLASGGPYLTTLWELRPQAYALVAFFLTSSLVRSRGDLIRLASIFLSVVALKALIADYRYLVTLHGDYSGVEAVMAHEESYFFALFLVGALAAALWCRRRWILISVIGLTPAVMLALIVNQRRAGVIALAAGIGLLLVLGIRFDLAKRRHLAVGSVLGVIAFALLLGIFWDHQSGVLGGFVRPFHSFYQPDPRDFLSNAYRQAENQNLLLTVRSSPIFGIGFGLPMLYVYPMADISKQYPLWNIIPHNTVLWIGMRMGVIGLAAFFGLIAMATLQAIRQGSRRDVFLRSVAIFAIAAIGMELVVGYVDLQLDNYRNLIFLGILLGVIQRLPRIRGVGARAEPIPPMSIRRGLPGDVQRDGSEVPQPRAEAATPRL